MVTSSKKTDMIRRWVSIAVVSLIPGVFVAAFLSMSWIRSQQGHGHGIHESKIESLAVRDEPADPLTYARARGRGTYEHYCQICHGEEGKGDGTNSSLLETQPRDFTDPAFWEKQTTEQRVFDAISEGGVVNGKSVLMPAWGRTLTDDQIRDLIVFVREFATAPEAQGE